MDDEIEIVYSPLQQTYTSGGHELKIHIYSAADEADWMLEVVDAGGSSTVWDDRFATDQEALDEALRTIAEEGVEVFLEVGPQKVLSNLIKRIAPDVPCYNVEEMEDVEALRGILS